MIEQSKEKKEKEASKEQLDEDIIKELGPIVNEPADNEECLRNIQTVFDYSVKNLSPYYLDKLGQSSDPIGQVAELVTGIVNNNAHVYHAAPVGSVMEREAIKIIGKGFDSLCRTCTAAAARPTLTCPAGRLPANYRCCAAHSLSVRCMWVFGAALGPTFVTSDELTDPQSLRIQ